MLVGKITLSHTQTHTHYTLTRGDADVERSVCLYWNVYRHFDPSNLVTWSQTNDVQDYIILVQQVILIAFYS